MCALTKFYHLRSNYMAILSLAFNYPMIDGNLSNPPHFTPSNLKIIIHHVDKWLMEAFNPPPTNLKIIIHHVHKWLMKALNPLDPPSFAHSTWRTKEKVGRWLIKALPHGKLSPFQTLKFSKTIKTFIDFNFFLKWT